VEQARSPPCHPFNANALKASPRLMPATKTHPMASSFPDPATERDATMPAFWYQYQIHKPKITYCGQMARQCISFGKYVNSVRFASVCKVLTTVSDNDGHGYNQRALCHNKLETLHNTLGQLGVKQPKMPMAMSRTWGQVPQRDWRNLFILIQKTEYRALIALSN